MRRLLATALVAGLLTTAASAETIYLTAGRMLDVQKGVAVSDPAVVITDGKITKVGTKSSLSAPEGAKTIDLGTQTILPGLIDLHVHLTSNGYDHGYNALAESQMEQGYIAVQQAQRTLQAGFTTVRDVGDSDYQSVDLAKAIDAGILMGPRIIASGPPLGATGGHMDNNLLPREYNDFGKGVADGPWAIRHMVRLHAKYGSTVIKFAASGGVLSKGDSVGGEQYSPEEMKALVDEAHMLGLKVAVHAHGTKAIYDAIAAGADTIEHVSLIDDAGIKLAKKMGTCLDFDIYNDDFIREEGEKNGILPESMAKEKMIASAQRANFTKAFKDGAKMCFGTDGGVYPNGWNARQFPWMVKLGMTPMQAIQAATVTNASALGKGDEIGAIAPGYAADIVATAGNPLDDVAQLEHVDFVMKGGTVVRNGK